ncbi:DUF6714 family protein [Microbulbifer sp. YPW1]|uniref:DUF6714 family protein n=1 Tax=Microbulbifer sp. YPW1 TaxID=2745199 RepID=UPI0015975440|nr:DUF6714 family protein [Microbulbifer sp. YPW1]QKX17657.1 hypothetical protein HUW35_12045 [Microbulbifer sp. YPW1]
MNDTLEIIERIKKAFDGVSRIGGMTLSQSTALDDGFSEEEVLAIPPTEQDEKWTEVPDKELEENDFGLANIDEIGFRYYLPAFMIYSLKYGEESPSNVCNHTGHMLCSPWDHTDTFSSEQKKAIKKYLKYMRDNRNDWWAYRALDVWCKDEVSD